MEKAVARASEEDSDDMLHKILSRHKVSDWDYLIFGDGSGGVWDRECGWASAMIVRETGLRRFWYGGASHGSVNFAEIMAYLQPLTWLMAYESDRLKGPQARRRIYKVHIFTDSRYCELTGGNKQTPKIKNALLWSLVRDFPRHGILLHWHWIPREKVALNACADRLSRFVRLMFKEAAPAVADKFGTPHDYNQDSDDYEEDPDNAYV